MTISPITAITAEGQPKELASFLRSGVMYVVWSDFIGSGIGSVRRVRWKPHTSGDFTEVIAPTVHTFNFISALYHQPDDSLIVVWDDGLSVSGAANGNIYISKFDVLTGAVIFGPNLLCQGAQPQILFRTTSTEDLLIYFKTKKNGGVYGRMSSDGGLTWSSGEPLVTGQVLDTDSIKVVPYDSAHVSIAQSGKDPRSLSEVGLFARTRPLSSIKSHPTIPSQFFISEPSKFDNTTLTDNLRGALVLSTNSTKLYHLDGVAQGSSDSIGAVALFVGSSMSVSASAGPVGGVAGRNLVEYSLTPALGALSVVLPGATSYAVDLGVSASYGYVAEYSNSTTAGQFVVVDLSSGTTATILSALTGVRAIAVANFTSPALIFVASTESGSERLRIYQENGLSPTLLLNVKMPARVNSLSVSNPGSPVVAQVLVSMVDRFGVYNYFSSVLPVRMVDTYRFSGGGQFFKSAVAANGNIFVAAGNAGVLAFDSSAKILSQLTCSSKLVPTWVAGTAYPLNSLIKARPSHPFSPNKYYFKATTGGTSGGSEPSWQTTGTVTDASVVWTPQAVIDGVVTDVAIDQVTKRVYAVGSVGGNLGTEGRVWALSAGGLL